MKEMHRENEASGGKEINVTENIYKYSVRKYGVTEREREAAKHTDCWDICLLEAMINRRLFGWIWSVWVGRSINKLHSLPSFIAVSQFPNPILATNDTANVLQRREMALSFKWKSVLTNHKTVRA